MAEYCPICGSELSTLGTEEHPSSQGVVDVWVFRCDPCGKEFYEYQTLSGFDYDNNPAA